jgi:hypothetical protein
MPPGASLARRTSLGSAVDSGNDAIGCRSIRRLRVHEVLRHRATGLSACWTGSRRSGRPEGDEASPPLALKNVPPMAYASRSMSFVIPSREQDRPESPEALFRALRPRDPAVGDLLLRQGDVLRQYARLPTGSATSRSSSPRAAGKR